jgi:hypothetical protein
MHPVRSIHHISWSKSKKLDIEKAKNLAFHLMYNIVLAVVNSKKSLSKTGEN